MATIQDWPCPTSKKQVKSFLGLRHSGQPIERIDPEGPARPDHASDVGRKGSFRKSGPERSTP